MLGSVPENLASKSKLRLEDAILELAGATEPPDVPNKTIFAHGLAFTHCVCHTEKMSASKEEDMLYDTMC